MRSYFWKSTLSKQSTADALSWKANCSTLDKEEASDDDNRSIVDDDEDEDEGVNEPGYGIPAGVKNPSTQMQLNRQSTSLNSLKNQCIQNKEFMQYSNKNSLDETSQLILVCLVRDGESIFIQAPHHNVAPFHHFQQIILKI